MQPEFSADGSRLLVRFEQDFPSSSGVDESGMEPAFSTLITIRGSPSLTAGILPGCALKTCPRVKTRLHGVASEDGRIKNALSYMPFLACIHW